jgi:KipI family sensor histidine kinase inhibitor
VIRPFGEASLLVELASSAQVHWLAASLRDEPIPGVGEVVPGRASLLVELADPRDSAAVADALATRLADLPDEPGSAAATRQRIIPVVYGGEHGPDLADVAAASGLSPAAVADLHAATELRVLFDGFAPGFAYLGDLPKALRVPRLATPRTRTPVGSVAVADAMSGIYPAELPGGWRVVGRTPITLFDARRDPPAYLVPGDAVRFEAIDASEWERRAGAQDDW